MYVWVVDPFTVPKLHAHKKLPNSEAKFCLRVQIKNASFPFSPTGIVPRMIARVYYIKFSDGDSSDFKTA